MAKQKKKVKETKWKKFRKWHIAKRWYILIIFILLGVWIFWGIPLPTNLSNNPAVSTKLLDRNGNLIYEIYTNERRDPVDLDKIPLIVKQATIAIEDKDFYKHHGFSPTGLIRAFYKTIFKQRVQGGSTLT